MPEQVQLNEEYAISKQELIDLMTDTDVKEAVKEALRADSINISNLPDAQSLAGKSLPIVENGALKSIPYATVIETVNTAASAANAAATAADTATASANAAATNANSAATTATSAAGTATTAAAQAIQAAETIPEEIEEAIADVLGGASSVDVQTIGNLLVEAGTAYKITQKKNHSTSTNDATFIKSNTGFRTFYYVEDGYKIYGVTVTMGGTDITSTAVKYVMSTRAEVNIESVTGEVVIDVKATRPIVFEDSNVKAICVENWGGNFVDGEITEYEAAQVTDLNAQFYQNTQITKFNELRYFIGLQGAGLYYTMTDPNNINTYRGQFYGCSNLTEITMPSGIRTSRPCGLFTSCSKLIGTLDLSGVIMTPTASSSVSARRFARPFFNCGKVEKIILPRFNYAFSNFYQPFKDCTTLKSIDFTGSDMSDYPRNSTESAENFNSCTALTDLPAGLPHLAHTLSLANNPLTHESAVNVLESLNTVTNQTITFKATTYTTLTAADIAIATAKGWAVASA